MIRRHKFFSQVELGGRPLTLRWILAAPEVVLSPEARQQRQRLLANFPQLSALTRQLTQLTTDLSELPLSAEPAEAAKAFDGLAKELMRDSDSAEQMLRELALRPEPAVRIAPPLRTLDQLENRLDEGQALLVFVATNRATHAVLITSAKQYKTWQLKSPARVRSALVTMMREIGNYDANQVLSADRLSSDTWKAAAAEIYQGLGEELSPAVLQNIKELTIGPDGFLWYLPFEMLQVAQDGAQKALIDLVAVRYAPTAGWAVADGRPAATAGNRVIVHGRLFSRDTTAITEEAAEQLREQHPRSIVLRKRLPVTTRFLAPVWQQLIVIDDIELNQRGPLSWSPAQIDQNKPGGALADWLQLPWGSPDVIALPGYHTLCEEGLRGRLPGDELMLATCGLMAAGTRTVLLSRWRTGGRASMELLREFFQEFPQQRAALAWQRSVLLGRSAELEPAAEPRLKGVAPGQVPSADHPFFWAGYLMMGAW
jgi:CHAT domain-containing protein